MATKKISELESMNAADESDVLAIVDVSEGTTKKITKGNLLVGAGHSIEIQLNTQTYQLEFKLKNEAGIVLSTQELDLPSENAVTGISYSNGNLIVTKQSGATSQVDISGLINGLVTETTFNQTIQTLQSSINAKYTKPSGGIPKTDLSDDVQTSLEKADSALQEHQDITGKEDNSNKVTELDENSTDDQYPSAKIVYDELQENYKVINKLQKQIETQKEIIDQMPQVSDSGEEAYLANTIKAPFTEFEVKGHSEQESTTGKNKLPVTLDLLKTMNSGGNWQGNVCTRNGITYTVNDDLSIKIGGVYSERSFFYLMQPSTNIIFPSERYQITGCPTGGSTDSYRLSMAYYDDSTYVSEVNETGGGNLLDLTSIATPKLQAIIEIKNSSAIGKTFYPMFRLASITDDTYEPYTGGQPAPSSSYPYPIKRCGDNVNILNHSATSQTVNGIEFTVKDDGTIVANGTATAQTRLNLRQRNASPYTAGTYTLSGCPAGGSSSTYFIFWSPSVGSTKYDYGSGGTITLQENETNLIYIEIKNGVILNNVVFKPKLEQGSIATPYSPYGCGNVNEKIQNKNLLNLNNLSNGSLSVDYGTILSSNTRCVSEYMWIKAGTYIINNAINNWIKACKYDKNKKFLGRIFNSNLSENIFTLNEDCYVVIGFDEPLLVVQNSKTQLEPGSIATSYVPHEEQTLSFPLAQGQKLMEGDYLADDGVHHVRGEYVFDGTENWTLYSQLKSFVVFGFDKGQQENGTLNKILCNAFIKKSTFTALEQGIWLDSNLIITTEGSLNETQTLSDFKAYLAEQYANGTPVIVQYELAEEQIDPYTSEQQAVYDQITDTVHTYRGGTYISSPDEVKVRIKVSGLKDLNTMYNDFETRLEILESQS